MPHTACFRFYEELNDFLPLDRRKIRFLYRFDGFPSIKDAVEAIGVPHTEIDLILVNGESVDFAYHLLDGDDVVVYPVFESLDIGTVTLLRPEPLREPRFILDVHLGKLARYLRMLGFDTLYDNGWDDHEIVRIALEQHRIILTCDVGLLKHGDVTHGYWVRSRNSREQLREVIARFDLVKGIHPFRRCLVCNGEVWPVSQEEVAGELSPRTLKYYSEFHRCTSCGRIYWKGSHWESMRKLIAEIAEQSGK